MTKNTFSAGGVVVNAQKEILVVNQKGVSWSLPKGHLEEDEDELTAAKREIHEKSGVIDLSLIRKLGQYSRYKIGRDGEEDAQEYKTITFFLFHTKETQLNPIDPDNPEARWIAPQEVADLLTHPKDKAFFTDILPTL